MKQPKKKPTPIKPAAAPEIPDWLYETPVTTYVLMAIGESVDDQRIEMSLAEYNAIKLHLAKLRGIEVPAEVQNAA